MEFCYEMPVWMSLGFISFLARSARSINIDKQSSVFSKGIQTNLSSSENKIIPWSKLFFGNIIICSCLLKSVIYDKKKKNKIKKKNKQKK